MTDDLLESRLRALHDALDVAPLPPPVDRPVTLELDRARPVRRRPRVLLAAAASLLVVATSATVLVTRPDNRRVDISTDTTTSQAPVLVGADGLFPGLANTTWIVVRLIDPPGRARELDLDERGVTMTFSDTGAPSGVVSCSQLWSVANVENGGRSLALTRNTGCASDRPLPWEDFSATITRPNSYVRAQDSLRIEGPGGTIEAVRFVEPEQVDVGADGLMRGLANTSWVVKRIVDVRGDVLAPQPGDRANTLRFSESGDPYGATGCNTWQTATEDNGERSWRITLAGCSGPGLWPLPDSFYRTIVQPRSYVKTVTTLRITGPGGTIDAVLAADAAEPSVPVAVGKDGRFPALANSAWLVTMIEPAGERTSVPPSDSRPLELRFSATGVPSGTYDCAPWEIVESAGSNPPRQAAVAAVGCPANGWVPPTRYLDIIVSATSYLRSEETLRISGPSGAIVATPYRPPGGPGVRVDASGLVPGLAGTSWMVVRFTDAAGNVSEPARGDVATILSFSAEGNPSIQDGCAGWVATTDQGRRTVQTVPVACLGPGLWQPPRAFVTTLIQPDVYLADATSLRIAGPQGTVDAVPVTSTVAPYVTVGPDGLFPGLANTSWVVIRHVGIDGSISAPAPGDAPSTLSFSSTGQPFGSVDCNGWSKDAVTDMGCPDIAYWQPPAAFLQTILQATSYRVDPVALHITGAGGTIHAAPA